MKPIYQTKFGMPDGNCFAACLASVLELDEIPEISGTDEDWFERVNEYLEPFGLYYFEFNYADPSRTFNFPGYYLMIGPGPRGINHAVVGFDGKMVHDPHPSKGGLKHIDNYGLFVCLNPKYNKRD